jgi:hypothetical protein
MSFSGVKLENETEFARKPLGDELAAYQLVGGVTAHQGYDG